METITKIDDNTLEIIGESKSQVEKSELEEEKQRLLANIKNAQIQIERIDNLLLNFASAFLPSACLAFSLTSQTPTGIL